VNDDEMLRLRASLAVPGPGPAAVGDPPAIVGRIVTGTGVDGTAVKFRPVYVMGDEVSGGAVLFQNVTNETRDGFVLRGAKVSGHAIFESLPYRWVADVGSAFIPCPGDPCIQVLDYCGGPLPDIEIDVLGPELSSGEVRIYARKCDDVTAVSGANVTVRVGVTVLFTGVTNGAGFVLATGLPADGTALSYEISHATEGYMIKSGLGTTHSGEFVGRVKPDGDSCTLPNWTWTAYSSGLGSGVVTQSGVTDSNGLWCMDATGLLGEVVTVVVRGYDPEPDECWDDAGNESIWEIGPLACNASYAVNWRHKTADWPANPCICCTLSCGRVPIPRTLICEATPFSRLDQYGPYGPPTLTCDLVDFVFDPFVYNNVLPPPLGLRYPGQWSGVKPGGTLFTGNYRNEAPRMGCDELGLYLDIDPILPSPDGSCRWGCTGGWYETGAVILPDLSGVCRCGRPLVAGPPSLQRLRPVTLTCNPFLATFEYQKTMTYYRLNTFTCVLEETVTVSGPLQTFTVYAP
jgi:hypothetical protein